ncbi:MAG: response regulator [Desulfuromonadaceae bacterium]|nr:response regulator [Desulfuromonadaceae bacterium]MDD2856006.1 response regulator [Desulfuromonadaceae bacterium]
MNSNILLVDDEANVLKAIRRALIDEPLDIMLAESAEEALEKMKRGHFKVVVSDERMPAMQGSEFLAIVKDLHPHTVRILLTGHATLEAAMNAVNKGEIYRFFCKPWDDTDLKFAIRSAVEKFDLEAENRRLLATVKDQAMEIKVLERRYPGISRVEKDQNGTFLLPDINESEIANLILECEREAKG